LEKLLLPVNDDTVIASPALLHLAEQRLFRSLFFSLIKLVEYRVEPPGHVFEDDEIALRISHIDFSVFVVHYLFD
jgi:hypothetical protein